MTSPCPRCSGLMVAETFIDYSENKHGSWDAYSCKNCGHVTDPVMEQNRALVRVNGKIQVKDVVRDWNSREWTTLEVQA